MRCVLVALAAMALLGVSCSASEMRYGTVRYEHVEDTAVRFFIHMQWRRTDAFGGSSDDDHRAKTGDSVEVIRVRCADLCWVFIFVLLHMHPKTPQ